MNIPELEEEARQVEPVLEVEEATETEVEQGSRLKRAWRWLTSTKKGRITAGAVAAVLVASGTVAATDMRYAAVGLVYHNHTTMTVTDSVTHQPLPGAMVSLGGQSAVTDRDGKAELADLNLGHSTLSVTKKAYKTLERAQLVPIGRLDIPAVRLESAGVALAFTVTDKISGQPVDGAEVSVGDIKAMSEDGQGRIVLLPESSQSVTAKVTKDGYLEGELKLDLKKTNQTYAVSLVPAGKVYYLSNRTGRLDLYSSNLDGSGATVVLPGTGSENTETGILPSIKNPDLLALVSTREGRRNSSGALLSDLFIFNANMRDLKKIEEDVPFYRYRAWVGDTLVYEQGNDCINIKSFRPSTQKSNKLFACSTGRSANINAVYDEALLYSVQSPGDLNLQGLYAVRNDGGNNRRLNSDPVTNLARQVKDTISAVYYNYTLSKPEVWTSINLENLSITKLDNGPSIQSYRSYVESPSEAYACFIEERDGKRELFLTDHDGNNERKLTSFGSASQFVQWYRDQYIVFSSTKSDENALYVVSVKGGQPQKVADFYRGNLRTYGGGYNPSYF